MSTRTDQLLAEWEPLPYPERMRRLAPAVAALTADGVLATTLAGLRAGDRQRRHLALMMAQIARDPDEVGAALVDDDPVIRATALRAALRAGWLDAAEVTALLADAPVLTRHLVYRTLSRLPRTGLADQLVDPVRSRYGDPEAARLLPGCGAETVERLLPELEHAVANWTNLVRHHRDPVLRYAIRTLPGLSPAGRQEWWLRCGGPLLRTAGGTAPHELLDLLDRYAPATYLPGELSWYGVLAVADPYRVVRLLTRPERAQWLRQVRLPSALLDRLGRLDPADLTVLADRLRDNGTAFARLLDAVPPSRRGALYDAVTAPVVSDHQVTDEAVLAVLPRRWRYREARRILALPRISDDEAATLRYTAFLPWPEAAPALTAATRRATAEDRATGYELLLAAAYRSADPDAVATTLDQLLRLRNEQDPVRARVLLALAGLARPLTAASVGTLERIVTDTTEARDASGASLTALSTFAVAVLRHHPDQPVLAQWSWRTFQRLFHGQRVPPLGALGTGLRRGQARDFFDTVRPWLTECVNRAEFQPLLAVAETLGRRAWALPDLQRLLRRAIEPDVVSTDVRRAVPLWLADPATRATRVEEVLRVDPSAIALHPVWEAVAGHRTDLLDLVLPGPVPAGRFLSTGHRWTPPSTRYVDRWLPRQQRALVDLLDRVAADAGFPVHVRVSAIVNAARVPEHGRAVVERHLDSPNVNLAEAALGALPWTDRPAEALPVLLAHADTERARVATYAAGRAVRFVAPSRLPAVLGGIATGRGKVTSRKEAVRLLGRFGGPQAREPLLAAWSRPDQHRDVRSAVVSAALCRLDLPSSWQILDEVVAAGRREELLALLDNPAATTAPSHRHRYAALVVRLCRHPDRPVARSAWAALPAWAPWAPDLVDVVVGAVSELDDEQTWPAVAAAFTRLLAEPALRRPDGGSALFEAALAALLRLDAADTEPGVPTADRPARRRIDALVDQMSWFAGNADPELDRTPARDAARALAGHPEYVPSAARLLGLLARLKVADGLVTDLEELAELAAGRPVLAGRLAERLGHRVTVELAGRDAGVLVEAGARLADRGDLASGLFAVALVGVGGRYGWRTPWRELLHRLRRHPVPDVRTAALDLVMS
ncbi:hypothetical protein [Plantactinospora sonchi]|uniref:PBS lyase n=1 Tax=Plantactinospora sonchi TaxID=1544735 RepID=A0ABU7S5B5_9ACTN